MYKTCTKCGIRRLLKEFSKDKSRKDGYFLQCKICVKIYKDEHYRKNKEKWTEIGKIYYRENKEICVKRMQKFHEKYPWDRVFYNAKARCENPNYIRYEYYGGRGIKFLLTKKQIKFLWFRDKAYLLKKPSIDRIDDNGHYILDNCQFIEHVENVRKSTNKPILQLSKQGKLIKK